VVRAILSAVLVTVVGGCSASGSGGPDAAAEPDAARIDAGGSAPDGAPLEVPFEDRAWGPLQEIGAGRYPEVVIDAQGNAMTTWEVSGVEGCATRRKPLEAAWGPVVALRAPQSREDEDDYCAGLDGGAALAIDGTGTVIALFTHERSGGGTAGMRSLYEPVAGWADAQPTGANVTLPLYVSAATNQEGGRLIGWAAGGEVWTARSEPSAAGWEAAVRLDASDTSFCCVRVVLDGAGNGLAVWKMLSDGELRAARLTDGAWSSAEPVDEGITPGSVQWDVGMNETGAALLVWRACNDLSMCAMRARRFDPSNGWSPSELIGDAGQGYDGRMIDVALDPDGNGIAAWATGPRFGPVGVVPRIEVARFRDGAWLPAETIGEGLLGERTRSPTVALDRDGNGLVAWALERPDQVNEDSYVTEYMSRTYMPAVGFGPVESLEEEIEVASRLELAMNPAGIALAVWSDGFQARARLFR
jgi:hypothetical protein